jgi:hypothetical protein
LFNICSTLRGRGPANRNKEKVPFRNSTPAAVPFRRFRWEETRPGERSPRVNLFPRGAPPPQKPPGTRRQERSSPRITERPPQPSARETSGTVTFGRPSVSVCPSRKGKIAVEARADDDVNVQIPAGRATCYSTRQKF